MEEMPEALFERFASMFGEGCVCLDSTWEFNGVTCKIPDFKIENSKLIRLSKVEAEAETILMNANISQTKKGKAIITWLKSKISYFSAGLHTPRSH